MQKKVYFPKFQYFYIQNNWFYRSFIQWNYRLIIRYYIRYYKALHKIDLYCFYTTTNTVFASIIVIVAFPQRMPSKANKGYYSRQGYWCCNQKLIEMQLFRLLLFPRQTYYTSWCLAIFLLHVQPIILHEIWNQWRINRNVYINVSFGNAIVINSSHILHFIWKNMNLPISLKALWHAMLINIIMQCQYL